MLWVAHDLPKNCWPSQITYILASTPLLHWSLNGWPLPAALMLPACWWSETASSSPLTYLWACVARLTSRSGMVCTVLLLPSLSRSASSATTTSPLP